MAPISGSPSSSSKAAPSSSISRAFSALSADGRLSRTRPTAPFRSTRTVFSCGSLIASLPLTLALGAEECRAAGLDDTAHPLGTGTARARLALPTVNPPAMLGIADLAVGWAIFTQRRAAGLDRLAQHRFDRGGELGGTGAGDGRRQPARRQSGAVERLADIDIAEPGDDMLIE